MIRKCQLKSKIDMANSSNWSPVGALALVNQFNQRGIFRGLLQASAMDRLFIPLVKACCILAISWHQALMRGMTWQESPALLLDSDATETPDMTGWIALSCNLAHGI